MTASAAASSDPSSRGHAAPPPPRPGKTVALITALLLAAAILLSGDFAPGLSASLAIVGGALAAVAGALALLPYLRLQIGRHDALLAKASEAAQRQRKLIAALPDAVAIIDEELKIEFANPAAERLYRYGPGELAGLPLAEIIALPVENADSDEARLAPDNDDDADRVVQRIGTRKDGVQFPIEISARRYEDSGGSKFILVVHDVTLRQANNLALHYSRESLARAQRMTAVGNFDRDLATGIIECSDEFLRIWGLAPKTLPSTSALIERVHPQDREEFVAIRVAVLSGRAMPGSEFRVVRPDGEERTLYQEYAADFHPDGRPMRLFGIVQDITERKAAEVALHRSRENLARAQRVARIGNFDRDLVTGRVEWSEEFRRIWGIEGESEDDSTEFLVSRVHPEDREKFLAGREAALSKKAVPPLDFRIVRPDGEIRFLHREYGIISDSEGRAVRLFGTVQDVTERKQIETELRRSKEDLARAQQIAAIGSFSREIATGKTEWSDEFLRIWGLASASDHTRAETLAEMIHPADREAFLQGRDAALDGYSNASLDFRITRPDGEERILHREYGILFDEHGKAARMFGTVQDVTERRKAERELNRSRENMARAQRLAGIGSFERDLLAGTVEWSDEMYRIFDCEVGNRPGTDELVHMIHPDDRERIQQGRADEAAGKTVAPFEYRTVRRDGAERIVRRETALAFDEDGRPARVFGMLQDITERKRAELEILRSRESMMRAQRIANMGSFENDLVTGQVEWSDQMYRVLNVDKDEVSPSWEFVLGLVHPDDRAQFIALHAPATRSNAFEFHIVRADGEERILHCERDVHFAEDGRPIRVFGTVQEITERRSAEARERELERQLLHSQKLEALGTLAGGIAHDLNNTLVPIMALSKLTARGFPPGTPVRANLDTIHEASERARDLVRRVLAFSRKDEPEQHAANLGEVVREALKLMRQAVPSSIQIDAAIADVPPVRADTSQIHQIVTNLVSNAAGAMADRIGTITVSLGLAAGGRKASEICLSVGDTGCGMDEATLRRIFEPFFTTKPVGQGTGLGLSIVHGIVASHGGRIEVKSVPGKGTRFDLYFPLPQSGEIESASTSSRPAA